MDEQGRVSRRTFLKASGGALAISMLPAGLAGAQTSPTAGGAASTTLAPLAADLTIRFQHLEPKVASPGLKAAWTFDEGAGYVFRDVSGAGHAAYATGTDWNTTGSGLTASLHHEGKRGGAVYLNGARWLQVRHGDSLQNGGRLTVSAWIKPDRPPAEMRWQSILQKFQGNFGYGMLLADKDNVRFAVRGSDGGDYPVDSEPGSVKGGEWVHLVGTADAATGRLRIYVNGRLSSSFDGGAFTPGNNTADLMIGRSFWLEGGFAGWIDEVTMHDRVLSPREVERLYAVGLPRLYIQTRETVDADRRVWNRYGGNHPVPHPVERDTVFSARYNGSLASDGGVEPDDTYGAAPTFVPGSFGGALDAVKKPGITYPSPIKSDRGTFEAWFVPVADDADTGRQRKKVLFRAEGPKGWLELYTQNGRWEASVGKGDRAQSTAKSGPQDFAYGKLLHVGVSWGTGSDGRRGLRLYLNGVEVGRDKVGNLGILDRRIVIGGTPEAPAHGYVDDVRISDTVREWGEIYPRGHVHAETSALDPMDRFDHAEGEPVALWRAGTRGASWRYAPKGWEDIGATGAPPESSRSLYAGAASGFHTIFHPDAEGYMSSMEAGVSFDSVPDGWAGVFVRSSSGPGEPFGGYSFSINPQTNQMRLAVHRGGRIAAETTLPYAFRLAAQKTYTLTLSSTDDGVLRGYVDGNNLISMSTDGQPASARGYSGLFTENTTAFFDNAHFSALTPVSAESRLVQQRLFADGEGVEAENLTLNAFRWNKRYGLLPWKRTYKDPEPPGNIFGAGSDVPERPNALAFWRSEDSANSDLISVDGKVVYFMRGNPRLPNGHGPAALGAVTAEAESFDGLHFADPNRGIENLDEAELLRGHRDTAPPEMKDGPPRDERFQVNDQGGAYVGGGKVAVFAREFRNTQPGYPWYRRLVYGLYDVQAGRWDDREGRYVEWSRMDPNDPDARFEGIDATPEVTSLRDPETDEYSLFLYHHPPEDVAAGRPPLSGAVTGLKFQGSDVVLDERYPTRTSYRGAADVWFYGERIFFDNGIYYLGYNYVIPSRGDWPDRFQLSAGLHPYAQTLVNSADNTDPDRRYFGRGEQFDHDNGAIWQGTMFKHRSRYYMYYENFHAIDNVNAPYQNYDALHAGSRGGYATGN